MDQPGRICIKSSPRGSSTQPPSICTGEAFEDLQKNICVFILRHHHFRHSLINALCSDDWQQAKEIFKNTCQDPAVYNGISYFGRRLEARQMSLDGDEISRQLDRMNQDRIQEKINRLYVRKQTDISRFAPEF